MKTRSKSNFLTASFSDVESAEKAYKSLRERGYYDNYITVVMSEVSMKKYFDKIQRRKNLISAIRPQQAQVPGLAVLLELLPV